MADRNPERLGRDLILVNSPLKNYDLMPRLNNFTLPTLGLGYIATCAEAAGFDVDLIDAESLGLGLVRLAELINERRPRWVGLNLLAPTYPQSVALLQRLDPSIQVMLGGHQAKAMPAAILADPRLPRVDALVLGEAETRVPRLLQHVSQRASLPKIYWREDGRAMMPVVSSSNPEWLAPDLDQLPFIDRSFLPQDPYSDAGVLESAMVAARGCPFDCSFCGAAVSANPDVTIRMRTPANRLAEMDQLRDRLGVQRVRFVDDLFLANRKSMRATLGAFVAAASPIAWDATGRINILASAPSDLIDLMVSSGCREVALGIESGSDRLLSYIDKKISVAQTLSAVEKLCRAGINVKGYFILGLPTESRAEHQETLDLVQRLRCLAEPLAGNFRCSAFEYRPYPGTPDWVRLIHAGYSAREMLEYDASDSAQIPADRDEFNFSTGIQFGEVPVLEIRRNLAELMRGERR